MKTALGDGASPMPMIAGDSALAAAGLPGPDRHLTFYGLASPPFLSGADPGRLWIGSAHRTILDTLARAIRDEDGIAILTGDAGTGKTSLSQRLISMLSPANIQVGRVSSPGAAPADFFEAVLSACGVRRPVPDKGTFTPCIRDVLARAGARGDKVLLVVDEAQGLSPELLGEVGSLSAMAAALGYPLVILLVGETRLTAALLDDRHAAVRERIIARCGVPPLGLDEVGAYIGHHLGLAGAATEVFSPEAIRRIASLSRGAPGAINIIGDRALLLGGARRAHPIGEAIVSECWRASLAGTDADHVRSAPRAAFPPAGATRRRRLYLTLVATALLVTGAPSLAWWLADLRNSPPRKASPDASPPLNGPAREAGSPAPAAVIPPPPETLASPAPAAEPDRREPRAPASITLPERPPVSAAPIEAHAALPARRAYSRPQVAVPRDDSALRNSPAARENPVPQPVIRPPVAPPRPPGAAPPARVAPPEPASPNRQTEDARADTPDPSAIIDWLMKESARR